MCSCLHVLSKYYSCDNGFGAHCKISPAHSKNITLYQVDISTEYYLNTKKKFHFAVADQSSRGVHHSRRFWENKPKISNFDGI